MQVELWEGIVAGAMALILLFFLGPRIKQAVERAPKANADDWKAVIVPLLFVVGFVTLMVLMIS